MSEALDNSPKQRSNSSLPRSPRSPPPLLPATLPVAEPLFICDYEHHPTGKFGCFRCIDDVLLQRLLLMVDENKVKVFSAPVIPIDMQQTEKKNKRESCYIHWR